MSDCWAAPIGGCKGKLSGEHLVSQGLLGGPKISVVGFPWCKNEPKEIGLASLIANHLCQQHNSDFSPVDQAGKDGFNAFRDAAILGTKRGYTSFDTSAGGRIWSRLFVGFCSYRAFTNRYKAKK